MLKKKHLQVFSALIMAVMLPSIVRAQKNKTETDSAKVQKEINSTIKLGNCSLKFGGFVKLDMIQDFKPIGQTDQFDISTIPVDGSTGTNFRIHARQSRFNMDFRAPVLGKEMRVYAEIDLWGDNNSYTPRLRHAYGSWGPVLAGQTWSTFVDDQAMPNTIDFESPNSFPNLRVPQLRLTAHAGKAFAFSFAFEEATHKIIIPSSIQGKERKLTPSFVGRVVYTKPKGHIQFGAVHGLVQFDPDSGSKQNAGIWGVSLSGKVKIAKKDAFMGSVTYGDGIGMYRAGGVSATFDNANELDISGALGIMAAYEHYWCDKVSSTVSYGYTDEFYDDGEITPESMTKTSHYASANLLWWFLGKYGYGGVEYIFGNRETPGEATGDAHRVQVAFKFILP